MKKRENQDKAGGGRKGNERFLRGSKTYAPRFQRLAQAIATARASGAGDDSHRRARLSHEECQAALEFYVDGELRGENTRTTYPAIFDHLKTCERCRISYDLLTSQASDENRELLLSASNSILPFLGQGTPGVPWSKEVRSSIGGGPLGFVLKIDPSHLARVIAQPPQFALRGPVTRDRSLLLLDSIALGRRDVQVELWLHRTANPDFARLEVSIVSSSPLPEPLRVNLRWNDHAYAASVTKNVGWIDQIPLAALENAPISVEFQAGQPSPASDE